MQDIYPDESYQAPYSDDYAHEPAPKKGLSGWLIALIVLGVFLVLCCLCLCGVVVLVGPTLDTSISPIMETLESLTPVP